MDFEKIYQITFMSLVENEFILLYGLKFKKIDLFIFSVTMQE